MNVPGRNTIFIGLAISVAENNQSLVDACDTVLLAILPIHTAQVLKDLRFRPEQTIISVIALKTVAELESLVNEAHEQICPYSHATRNNVAVDFVVKGG